MSDRRDTLGQRRHHRPAGICRHTSCLCSTRSWGRNYWLTSSLTRSYLLPSAQEGRVLSAHLGQAPHVPQGKPGLVDRLREPSSNASSAHLAGSEPSWQVSTSPLSEHAGLEPSLHRRPPTIPDGWVQRRQGSQAWRRQSMWACSRQHSAASARP